MSGRKSGVLVEDVTEDQQKAKQMLKQLRADLDEVYGELNKKSEELNKKKDEVLSLSLKANGLNAQLMQFIKFED